MDDDFTNQAIDMIFENKTINRKVKPIIFGSVAFNLVILFLLLFIIFKIHVLTGVFRESQFATV